MISVCLLSDALLQNLLSYLGFSYLGHGVSLHGCSSKVQPLLLSLDERYLLTIYKMHIHDNLYTTKMKVTEILPKERKKNMSELEIFSQSEQFQVSICLNF